MCLNNNKLKQDKFLITWKDLYGDINIDFGYSAKMFIGLFFLKRLILVATMKGPLLFLWLEIIPMA
jgi:hypothetical protein